MDGEQRASACPQSSTVRSAPAPADSPVAPLLRSRSQTHGEVGQPDAELVISRSRRSGGKANNQESAADSAAEGGQARGLTNRRRRHAGRTCVNEVGPGGVRVVAPPLSRVAPKTLPTNITTCVHADGGTFVGRMCGGAEEERRAAGVRPRGRPELLSIGRIRNVAGRRRRGRRDSTAVVNLPRTWVRACLGSSMEVAVGCKQ
jgi:hypothetical protein